MFFSRSELQNIYYNVHLFTNLINEICANTNIKVHISTILAYEAAHIHVIVSGDNFNYPCGGEYPGPTQENDIVDFLCPSGTVGSKVTLHKQRPHAEHLTLCEVEVFGNLYP